VSGLSWELLWQHRTSIALGVSAYGTAVTLSAMMAGMGLGSLLAVAVARRGRLTRPLWAFGIAELLVGLGGLAVPAALQGLSELDAWLHPISPELAPALHLAGMILLLLLPATAMGASIPILASCVRRFETSIPVVYALNVFGAVAGVLVATFLALPLLGVADTERLAAVINCCVALWAISRGEKGSADVAPGRSAWPRPRVLALAFSSGFAIFALEVSWFRSLRAALQSTTESFALVLAAFLAALALGAWLAPLLRRRFPESLPVLLPLAALAVLAATPAIDSLDRWVAHALGSDWTPAHFSPRAAAIRFICLFGLLLPPAALLGMILPWLLSEHESTEGVGRLYAVNTVGAVSGALLAGFALLPWLGATRTSWIAALAVLAAGCWANPSRRLAATWAAVGLCGVALAIQFGSGTAARLRVQGFGAERAFASVQYVAEGPDSTVWVTRGRTRNVLTLVIDGFAASNEGAGNEYMLWMGHLPALARPRVENALVIGFGTGQTTHAVRQHDPSTLYVADVSAAVFGAAHLFESNQSVLEDPRVRAQVMDGRAFLRRHRDARLDLVTLEPMPPNFAGVNNLYSLEFYELVRERLVPGGVAAQWVPFHLIAPAHMQSIIATFYEVFPYTRLWVTPFHGTGILVGSDQPWRLRRSEVSFPPHAGSPEAHFELGFAGVADLSRDVPLITDDNQLLAYGYERFRRGRENGRNWYHAIYQQNRRIIDWHSRRSLGRPTVGPTAETAGDLGS
jgi:spermidine synthase